MTMPSTSSTADESPPYHKSLNQYGFLPEVYNAPALFPHNSLDAAEIDHLAETLITAFRNVALAEVLPANAVDQIYPTISQIALPAILQDEFLSAYQFFMFHCISSDHGQSFCLGMQPNRFHDLKTLTLRTHPKVITALEVPKKKKKKQKDEWNKSPEVDGEWFLGLTTCMPLAALLASPCFATKYTYIKDLLVRHPQNFDLATRVPFYNCMWYRADGNPGMGLMDWMNRIPERELSLAVTRAPMCVTNLPFA
uniref:Uncharacterized protein n=1 Tax=Romanomermis culicivorax TaxID=13658 RepID=A0A915J0Z9_ROMCU